jgi:adenylate cyclase
MIRVVLGEDNVLVREGVRALLDSFDDIEVVAVAADAPSLLEAAGRHTPDVVVTDIKMPPNFRLEGIDCAHAIRDQHPGTGVVVLSAHDDEEYAVALLGKGQSGLGYLLKDRIAQGDELVRAIREVAAGRSMVDPTIAERLAGHDSAQDEDRTILDLMAKGMGYPEMAQALDTTQEAVDRRVSDLFRRMAGGTGESSAAVDELKRLHAAVVERATQMKQLRSFVPPQLAAGLESGAIAERREAVVSVLFADIRGYSTIAERLSAAEIADILARQLGALGEIVAAHRGSLDELLGDAVMAVFGAPEPMDDHAERALRCAIAMQARQRELNAEGWTAGLPEIGIGVGVNTGTVVAGTVGGGGRLKYTVVGDAVNVAARLQSEAQAGEILASATTIADANGVRCEAVGPRHVKGREEPVEVFRVVVDG